MNISRISKAIAEVRRDQSFGVAESVRNIDIDLLLPDALSDSTRQMAKIATALALRCFKGRVRIHCPTSDSLLRLMLQGEAKKVGAAERLDFSSREIGLWRLALGLRADGTICADASGWTARINGVFSKGIPAAAPAITFAVTCAFAKLFNQAIFGVDEHCFEEWDFCLLRFLSGEHEPMAVERDADLGRVGLLGAGAIGSAVGYVLSLSNWSGRLDVIDFDYFEDPNLETCISADITSVNKPLRKAFGLVQSFNGHRIVAVEHNGEVKEGEAILGEARDSFVCAVDNPETRRILDNVNATVLINAGLGATKHDVGWVLWTQHGKGNPTLSSIYKDDLKKDESNSDPVPQEFREECSRKSYHGVSLALPFVALAAGSLLTASLYQRAVGRLTKHSWMQIDLFAKQARMTFK